VGTKEEPQEHLSVLEYKREQRAQEVAELEQTLDKLKDQRISVQKVEQIEVSQSIDIQVSIERKDYNKRWSQQPSSM
jgi:hypothetical protein